MDLGSIRKTPFSNVFLVLPLGFWMYTTDLHNLEETFNPSSYLTKIVVSASLATLFFYFLRPVHIPFEAKGSNMTIKQNKIK